MSDGIASVYASNVGQLILNLTGRGLLVRMLTEDSVIGGKVLMLQISDVTKKDKVRVIKEALTEDVVTSIRDVAVIADALVEKLKKS